MLFIIDVISIILYLLCIIYLFFNYIYIYIYRERKEVETTAHPVALPGKAHAPCREKSRQSLNPPCSTNVSVPLKP